MYRKCCRDTTCTQCGKNCQSVVLIFFHTLAQLFNGPLSRTTQVGRYQKKHSPTHTHPDHQTSFINFLHLLRSIASSCASYMPNRPFPQPLSRSSLVYLLVWNPILHTPYISSPNHDLLFAAHAHTITACSAAVPRLCHPFLSLNALLANLSFTFTPKYLKTGELTDNANLSFHRHRLNIKLHVWRRLMLSRIWW